MQRASTFVLWTLAVLGVVLSTLGIQLGQPVITVLFLASALLFAPPVRNRVPRMWPGSIASGLFFAALLCAGQAVDANAHAAGFASASDYSEARSHNLATPVELAAWKQAHPQDKPAAVIEDRCPSWDGSVSTVIDAVKQTLRDPGSFEHIKTVLVPQSSPEIRRFMMSYRAKNGFGGYNVVRATGGYDPSRQCELFDLNGTRIYHLDFNRRMPDAEKSPRRFYPTLFPTLQAAQQADLKAYRGCLQWEARKAFPVDHYSTTAIDKAVEKCRPVAAKLAPYLSEDQLFNFSNQEMSVLVDWINEKT